MTRSQVTVSLSGDGGDELFCGYNRYRWVESLWQYLSLLPLPLRKLLATPGTVVPTSILNRIYQHLLPMLPTSMKVSQFENKFQKVQRLMAASSSQDLYFKTLSTWDRPEEILLDQNRFPVSDAEDGLHADLKSFMMWHDQTHYLPDDIMVKVDRASMAVSLEARAPFLDHELIELVCALPLHHRVGQNPKELLKSILFDFVPRELIERPKMGFSIPMQQWLKTDFQAMTLDLLSAERLKQQGLFETEAVQKLLHEFYQKDMPRENLIWPLLVFQLWHQQWFQ
jgi:asparagine synthase (glutamine-hydrolysing)